MKNFDNMPILEIEDLQYSDEYANYIMTNGDPETCRVADGDSLLEYMENGYMFKEFLATLK